LAERLLGHPYTLSGRVAHGAKLGRKLGFPDRQHRAAPARRRLLGIYVVDAGKYGPGVASVGRARR